MTTRPFGRPVLIAVLAGVAEKEPAMVCISSLPPGGLAHTRYLCKRLRASFPKLKIVVGRWGLKNDIEKNQQQLQEAGADLVGVNLLETRNQINSHLGIVPDTSAGMATSAA